jgi:hypothetical protein
MGERAGSKDETCGGVSHQRLRAGVGERAESRDGRKSKEQGAKRRRAVVSAIKGFAQGWEKE